MIKKFENFKLITEDPDSLYDDNGNEYDYEDDDAIPFFINVNSDHTSVSEIFIGDNGVCHGEIYASNYKKKLYPGRLWMNNKIMSFWVYPNPTLFKSIIKELEYELDIDIFNNNWRVEVIKSEDNKLQYKNKSDYDNFAVVGYYDLYEIIPVERYIGSGDVPEEIQIQHLMKWDEKELAKKMGKIHFKGFGSDKTAWDSKHNIKYRQAIYQENMNLIKETPDNVYYPEDNIELGYTDEDAIPFYSKVNFNHTKVEDVIVGNYKQWHADILNYNWTNKSNAYAGRLWEDEKIMSFWIYPNVDLFRQMIRILEKKLNTKIFNNEWVIEVIQENGKIITKEFDDEYEDDDYLRPDDDEEDGYDNMSLIPLDSYAGSDDVPEELQIQHLMKWDEKELAKKMGKIHFKGFGSDKTAWDSKHNIKYRQAIYQENNKNI